jgi:hypothetical protein
MIALLLVGLASADIIMPSPPPRVPGAVDPEPPALEGPSLGPLAAVPLGLVLGAGALLLVARRRTVLGAPERNGRSQ